MVVAGMLAACQTTGLNLGSTAPSDDFLVAKASYNFLYDQKDHLNELISAGNYADASILYEEQREFFDGNLEKDPALAEAMATVVAKASSPVKTQLSAALARVGALAWPAEIDEWGQARTVLSEAEAAIVQVPKSGVFVNAEYAPTEIALLSQAVQEFRAKASSTIVSDFSAFDHFSNQNFFGEHPSAMGAQSFFATHPDALTQLLTSASAEHIALFGRRLGKENLSDAQWNAIGNAYADKRSASLPRQSRSLADILRVVDDTRNAGFNVTELANVELGFVEVTSRTLLKQGQIDFPAEIEIDLPFEFSKADLESDFDTAAGEAADYLIVFDVALAKARRQIKRMQKQRSEVIVGYEKVQNPEHTRVQTDLSHAQMQLQTESMNVAMANSQFCHGLACIGKAISVAAADEKRIDAQARVTSLTTRLNTTPSLVDIPVKQPYNYEVGQIDATKTMTVHYYVIDKSRKRYFKSTFDVVETERFGVAYRVAQGDPNRDSHIAKHDTEEEVSDWERAPSSVKLSDLVNHYLANEGQARRLTSLGALRKEMLKDRNTAIAEYKSNTFEESTANDQRFESVVAIYMPEGSVGTGFFVEPDVVMTNYHVVEEGDFLEMKMHDEQETFGRVIARDAGLDLALIRVQTRGKPVRFYNRNKIELGSTVEVIGHPRGYEFSVTRGVVSAIRNQKSANLVAGPDVLHVQIDAATSPGNSGGPVFMRDRVISVVSWGRVDRGSENLNFTVHHSEAERFLREALGGQS